MKNLLYCALAAAIISFGGCCYLLFFHVWRSESVYGVSTRMDDDGRVIQEIVVTRHHLQRGISPGPHGPVPVYQRSWYTTELREPGKPPRELRFLVGTEHGLGQFCPVRGTRLWLSVAYGGSVPYSLLLFDDTHIVRQREIEGLPADSVRGRKYAILDRKYMLSEGNRLFIYLVAGGALSYDVIADTTRPWNRDFMSWEMINGESIKVVLHPPFDAEAVPVAVSPEKSIPRNEGDK